MSDIKRIAEALVECGYWPEDYATSSHPDDAGLYFRNVKARIICDPFADTLEGRRQADALAEWFFNKHRGMWDALQFMKRDEPYNNHEHLCKQLRTGFEQLEAQSE